jgi:hypothetical protein
MVRGDLKAGNDAILAAVAMDFGRSFYEWCRILFPWLELWTGQAIRWSAPEDQSGKGNIYELGINPPPRSGWGPAIWVLAQRTDVAIDRETMVAACERASRSDPPPLEWMTYLQATGRGGVHIIEAATAAEIALTRALDHRLGNLPAAARDRIAHDANGLAGLVRLVEAIDGVGSDDSKWRRVADRLANPRNRAVHAGETASAEAAKVALAEAKALLDAYSPLPGRSG